uniref:CxC2-like cysteine cluster KDZ transposase-associated domain-containing protein n=1 Tax=Mycena chlorophos TaxID=658473 RepID=A0ABQ0LNN4_MYCCL|nr:predicted protein [Mycena chlorophos]
MASESGSDDEDQLDLVPEPGNDPIAGAGGFDPPPPSPTRVDQRARVEEVSDEDMDVPGSTRWEEAYPTAAGTPLDGGKKGKTRFEVYRDMQMEMGLEPWAPFDDEADWALARWLVEAGVSKGKIEEFLKLDKIKFGAKPSYRSAYTFYQKIDALPSGPAWSCDVIKLTGDKIGDDGKPMEEEVEFWYRDALECIEDIMGNPAFKEHMNYAPKRVYRDEEGTNREYSEMCSGDLWWGLQGKIPVGHMVVPVIVGTDETQLSKFSGDKKAWPCYAIAGNVDFDIRRKPSKHAAVLLGYIPVSKLHIFTNAKRSNARHQLFHDCMRKLLSSLKEAGKSGTRMLCSDQHFRTGHPLYAGHLADHPERCLASCCEQNRCEFCKVPEDKRGDPILSEPRDPQETLRVLQEQANGLKPAAFEDLGLRRTDPFWKDLPHANIHTSFPPDILHQLDKGVFKDHSVQWATEAFNLGSEAKNQAEVDKRMQAMPSHPSMRHFGQGISLVAQWTGNEYGHMEKQFVGAINGIGDPDVIAAIRAILDFIYYAHFEVHTSKSLQKLHEAWLKFHQHKHIFIRIGIREHFNIPKVHAMWHYVRLIQLFGSAGGTSTELSERLHIDCAKLGYRASNRKNYLAQMTRWLSRREAIWRFTALRFHPWLGDGYA